MAPNHMVVSSSLTVPVAVQCGTGNTMTDEEPDTDDSKRDCYAVQMEVVFGAETHSELSAKSKAKSAARKMYEADSVEWVECDDIEVIERQ